MPTATGQKVRFGVFELDRISGELFKLGYRLNLRGQPIEVLSILLEQPGELVTREDLCKRLWPQDTFVDFEHSLNTAIKKLRQTLDDDVEMPRYIETLPKKGYRFIAKAELIDAGAPAVAPKESAGELKLETVTAGARRWRWFAAALIVLAIIAGLSYWLLRPRTPVVITIRQLTHTGRHKSSVGVHSIVSDGMRVYFDEFDGTRWHIAEVSTKGGDVSYLDLPLIPNPRVADLSQDGSDLLAFDWTTDRDDPAWLVSLPNGPARKIPDLHVVNMALVPGSKELIYAPTNATELFSAKVDGSGAHRLLSVPGSIIAFAIAPDGKRISLSIDPSSSQPARLTNARLWECRRDGSGLRRMFPRRDERMAYGRWSLDGKIFGYAGGPGETVNLWTANEYRLGGYRNLMQPVQLTHGPVPFFFWTFSKDGKHIYALGEFSFGELVTYDGQSNEARSFLNGLSAGFVDFSRDGQWVTYVAYPELTLWRSRVDGSEKLQLTFQPMTAIVNPKWSPDGRFIAFQTWRTLPNKRIYLVSAHGGNPMLLVSGDFNPADPTWSPDSKSIAYGGGLDAEGKTDIRILNLDTMRSTSIRGSLQMYSPRWSPNGRYLIAQTEDGLRMSLYTFENSSWKELPAPTKTFVGWQVWSHDSRYLYFSSDSKIYRYRIPEGQVELVARLTGLETTCPIFHDPNWFTLTPDERILVLRDRGTDEVYALDLEYR
jgi:DNA-binding winged helix-turn-helix (wHTH) protein/Tol biopolymer transport system component